MARIRMIAAGIAVVALAAITSSPMVAMSQGGGRETIRVKSPDSKVQETEVDVDGDGSTEGVGDQFIGTAPVFRGGERAGSERHICTVMKSGRRSVLLRCEGTFNLEGRGSLEIAGILKFGPGGEAATFTITGGTAGFRGAGGTMEFGTTRNATIYTFKVSN